MFEFVLKQQIWLAGSQEHYVLIICFKEHHLYFCMEWIFSLSSLCACVCLGGCFIIFSSCVCLYRFVLIFLILSFEVLTALKVSRSYTLHQGEMHLVYNKMPSKWKQIVRPTMQHLGPPLLGWLAERRRRMRLFIFSAERPHCVSEACSKCMLLNTSPTSASFRGI